MVTFYNYPKKQWQHLRTTNPVESPFAGLRLRTDAAKRFKKVENAQALIWKMLLVAEKRFRRLKAPGLMKDVYQGAEYVNGVLVKSPGGESRLMFLHTYWMQVVGAHLWTTKPKQNNHGRRALTRYERGPAPPVTLRELDNLSSTQGRLGGRGGCCSPPAFQRIFFSDHNWLPGPNTNFFRRH